MQIKFVSFNFEPTENKLNFVDSIASNSEDILCNYFGRPVVLYQARLTKKSSHSICNHEIATIT